MHSLNILQLYLKINLLTPPPPSHADLFIPAPTRLFSQAFSYVLLISVVGTYDANAYIFYFVTVYFPIQWSAVECRTHNQVSPGLNPPLLPLKRLERLKRFERSNGPDIALYKITFTFLIQVYMFMCLRV